MILSPCHIPYMVTLPHTWPYHPVTYLTLSPCHVPDLVTLPHTWPCHLPHPSPCHPAMYMTLQSQCKDWLVPCPKTGLSLIVRVGFSVWQPIYLSEQISPWDTITYARHSRWSIGHQRPPAIALWSGLLLSFWTSRSLAVSALLQCLTSNCCKAGLSFSSPAGSRSGLGVWCWMLAAWGCVWSSPTSSAVEIH